MLSYKVTGISDYGTKFYKGIIEGKDLSMDEAINDFMHYLGYDYYVGAEAQRTEDGMAWKIELEVRENL